MFCFVFSLFFTVNKAFMSKQLNQALGIRPPPVEKTKVEKQPRGRQIDFFIHLFSYSIFLKLRVEKICGRLNLAILHLSGVFFFFTKQEISMKIDFSV